MGALTQMVWGASVLQGVLGERPRLSHIQRQSREEAPGKEPKKEWVVGRYGQEVHCGGSPEKRVVGSSLGQRVSQDWGDLGRSRYSRKQTRATKRLCSGLSGSGQGQ